MLRYINPMMPSDVSASTGSDKSSPAPFRQTLLQGLDNFTSCSYQGGAWDVCFFLVIGGHSITFFLIGNGGHIIKSWKGRFKKNNMKILVLNQLRVVFNWKTYKKKRATAISFNPIFGSLVKSAKVVNFEDRPFFSWRPESQHGASLQIHSILVISEQIKIFSIKHLAN